jgi:hypothetical protein
MRITDETRELGVVVSARAGHAWCCSLCGAPALTCVRVRRRPPLQVCRGTAVTMVSPTTGAEEIANPFLQQAEEQ